MTNPVYFVTGATGTVGSAFVAAVLRETQADVFILMRAPNAEALKERHRDMCAFWAEEGLGAMTGRVHAMAGDVTLPRFGLSEADYQRVTSSTTHIVHAAGIVRLNLPLNEARSHAVLPAQYLLDIAGACQTLQKIEFISTVGVGGRWNGSLPERWLHEPRSFHNTYEQAKAEAETLLEQSVHKFPITVHRPSMVVGHSITGRSLHQQVFAYLCLFLSGLRSHGLLPRLQGGHLDTIPSDILARFLLWSSQTPDVSGRIFHLCAGPDQHIGLGDLHEMIVKTLNAKGVATPKTRFLPLWLYAYLVRGALQFLPKAQTKPLRPVPVFLDYLRSRQTFGCSGTADAMARAGIVLPDPQSYLPAVLDFDMEAFRGQKQ